MGNKTQHRIQTPKHYESPSRFAEPIITWLFRKSITRGRLALQFATETVEVGSGPLVCIIAPPSLKRFVWMMLKPDYRIPSYYTYGYWCCEDRKLGQLLELLTAQAYSPLHWWVRLWNRNPIRDKLIYKLFPLKVKENIAAHYNTNPDFMKLLLGKHLEYTCAFFEEEHDDLDRAQQRKINRIIRRLSIEADDDVLDLGCGWGQIAETISKNTGATVTGVSITENQISYASKNSSERTSFVRSDYEAYNPNKVFSKLYSIGMVEHIGKGKLDSYFKKISTLIVADGQALIHCIVRTREGSTNSWIDREVFPGAYIPELSEVVKAIDRSQLHIEVVHTHDRVNYYRTLQAWTDNLYANWDELDSVLQRKVSKNDACQILRIWEFYLNGSQIVFNESTGYCYNVQIVLSRQMHDPLSHLITSKN